MTLTNMRATYGHPHPFTDRIAQYGGMALVIVMLLGVVGQIALGLVGLPLFLLSGLVTLGLIAPVIMLTSATPAVSVSAEGITILPLVWRGRLVRWSEVRAVKDYPLLPPKDVEVGRRTMVGRQKYRPAEGKMLVIPSLPLPYRITGLFAGEGFTGVIGLTNRTHTDYDKLIKQVSKYTRTED